jgi:hypothetical protein
MFSRKQQAKDILNAFDKITEQHLQTEINVYKPIFRWFTHSVNEEIEEFFKKNGKIPTVIKIKYNILSEDSKGKILNFMSLFGCIDVRVDSDMKEIIVIE